MEQPKPYLYPEDMTPEERLERIVELLATASLRLISEKKQKAKDPKTPETPAILSTI